MDRRTFLGGATGTLIGATIGGGAGVLLSKKFGKSTEDAETIRDMKPGECHDNMVNTLTRVFTELHKGEALFYDEEGVTVMKYTLPIEWELYTPEQKQSVRDWCRKDIGEKFGIDALGESELPMSTPQASLRDKSSTDTMASLAKNKGSEITKNDPKNRTRMKYLSDMFQDFGGKGSLIASLMANHIIGLAGAESGFDSAKPSSVGAVGILQLMPVNINNKQLNPQKWSVEEVSLSLMKQVEIAKRLFLDDWRVLERKYKTKIATAYFSGNTEDTIRYALFPALINSYNTGLPNMCAVIDSFMKEYENKNVIEDINAVKYDGGFGYDLFWYISRYGLENRETIIKENGKSVGYGSDSAGYFYKSIAMSKGIKGDHPSTAKHYVPIGDRSMIQGVFSPDDVIRGVGGAVVGVLVGVGIGSVTAGVIPKSRRWIKRVNMTRRDALRLVGGLGILAVLGLAGTKILKSQAPKIVGERGNIRPNIIAKKKEEYEPESGLPDDIRGELFPKDGIVRHIPIATRHHSKTITPWLKEKARNLGIKPIQSRPGLKMLSGEMDAKYTNLDYRPREMGASALREAGAPMPIGTRNHPEYLRLHERAEKLIRDISKELNVELEKICGLNLKRYRVRLIISSAVRDRDYASKYLKNASDDSSHPYGIAFDIAHKFDIIDLQTRKSHMITDGREYIKIKHMLDTLISKRQNKHGTFQGSLFAIQEQNPPHIHITTRLGEEVWKPAQAFIRTPKLPTRARRKKRKTSRRAR